jgi:MEDS: MEthanogen/methylotroph, DcmR Sensory domain
MGVAGTRPAWRSSNRARRLPATVSTAKMEGTMTENLQPVRLAGSALSRSCHVCAFFHSKEEEYRVLMPFIKDGFDRGDRAFHVVDAKHRAAHLERLAKEGIDVANAQDKGQLEVRRWD